jgi:hypothetical protein
MHTYPQRNVNDINAETWTYQKTRYLLTTAKTIPYKQLLDNIRESVTVYKLYII